MMKTWIQFTILFVLLQLSLVHSAHAKENFGKKQGLPLNFTVDWNLKALEKRDLRVLDLLNFSSRVYSQQET